jgi:trehalose 6-phosphate synthase
MKKKRLVVVSNRLPIVVERRGPKWKVSPGTGGLVTALAPVLRGRGGLWIGWPGTPEAADVTGPLEEASREAGYDLAPVVLSSKQVDGYYHGFSNEVMWPLFHDFEGRCNFEPRYWESYQEVNRKFAEKIVSLSGRGDFVWVQDYHLMCVGRELRAKGFRARLGYFQHIPFPPADMYLKLPWRQQVIEALLTFDLIGFQTVRDRNNFLLCVRRLLPDAPIQGKGNVQTIQHKKREVRVGAFPIGIDYSMYAGDAGTETVKERALGLHRDLPDRQLILGLDRLDYTKGIPHRLKAFRNLLRRYPKLRGKVTMIQIVVPSRKSIPEYAHLKEDVERLVGDINGEYTRSGWVPIHYMFRSLSHNELLAYYRTAEIALITPLKDGMNLVAKEYCAASTDENGVLILSEFAGAAGQLGRHALVVNPYDILGVADAIHQAYTMPPDERRMRMRKLRQLIRKNDVFSWVDSVLAESFPESP